MGYVEVLKCIFIVYIGFEVLKVAYSIFLRRKLLNHIKKLAKENEKSL